MVQVNRFSGVPRRMEHGAIDNLVTTGMAAIDILANMAGGHTADLNVPRVRWAISGLAIQTSDATSAMPETGTSGGQFRFDELRAAYAGIGEAVAGIGDMECSFGIWRVTPIMKRKVRFLGYGYLQMALMAEKESKNGMISVA
ncbi:MAG: hypothetical protein Q9210_006326 [Variospora velana]